MQGPSLITQRLKLLATEVFRLYLDQMFSVDVAQALREQGNDVVRASETDYGRADDQQIL